MCSTVLWFSVNIERSLLKAKLSLSFSLQDIQKDSCESNHNITCKVGYPFLKPAEEVKSLPACKFFLLHVVLRAGQSISPLKFFYLVFIPKTLYACFSSYPWHQLHRVRWETIRYSVPGQSDVVDEDVINAYCHPWHRQNASDTQVAHLARSVFLEAFHILEPINLVILCIKYGPLIVERIRHLCGSANPDLPKSGTKTSPLLHGEWEAFPASRPLKLHLEQFQWCLYLLLEWRGSFS